MPPSLTTPPPPADADLDAQIQRVEQRLIDREARLHHGAAGLARDVRRALRPRRLVMPVASVAIGLAALLSLRRRSRDTPPPAAAADPAGAGHRLPWSQLAGVLWPLMPARWRERLGPAAATSLLTLGLPLLEQLAGGRASGPPLNAVPVDLARVTGRWFLVGELGSPLQLPASEPPELGLLPREDGQFELLMRRIDASGTHGSEARVEAVPGSHGGRWRVSHWPEALHGLSWAWRELAVLQADEPSQSLLLGSASRDTLWLLARRPTLEEPRRAAALDIAQAQGFDTRRLRFFA